MKRLLLFLCFISTFACAEERHEFPLGEGKLLQVEIPEGFEFNEKEEFGKTTIWTYDCNRFDRVHQSKSVRLYVIVRKTEYKSLDDFANRVRARDESRGYIVTRRNLCEDEVPFVSICCERWGGLFSRRFDGFDMSSLYYSPERKEYIQIVFDALPKI